MTIERTNPNNLPRYAGVSHVVSAGNFVFITGQVGSDSSGNTPDSVEEQLDRIYQNLEAACQAAGGTLQRMVKTITYITDASYFPAVTEARAARYGENGPANSTIIVRGLAKPEWLVEIEGIAYMER